MDILQKTCKTSKIKNYNRDLKLVEIVGRRNNFEKNEKDLFPAPYPGKLSLVIF